MIDLRAVDLVEDEGYEVFKDKEGNVYKVGLIEQKYIMRLQTYNMKIEKLQKEFNRLQGSKETEKNADKLAALYERLVDLTYEVFLFLLNMNTSGKKFALEDIKNIPMVLIQQECNNYIAYIGDKLKN